MHAYQFFSLFSFAMMLAIMFSVIFIEDSKKQTFFGMETLITTAISFVIMNMTPLDIYIKNIVVIVVIILYIQIMVCTFRIVDKQGKDIGKEIK